MKICYTFGNPVSDRGFSYHQNLGRAWVDAELGTTSRYVQGWGFEGGVPEQERVLDAFVADGCQVIVLGYMVGFVFEYVERHPHVRFVCLTCWTFDPTPSNLAMIEIRLHQAGFIGGVVAAMQHNVNRIGYVGGPYSSPSFRNVNSFALGALSVRPNISLVVMHTGEFFAPRTERIASMRLIEQHGVDLLAYDSDSTEVVEVAKEVKRLSIASKVDGTAAFGETNLVSRIFEWNTPLKEAVAAAFNLTNWTEHRRDNEYVGFEKDAVSLGTFSTAVDLSARVTAMQLQERFKAEGDFTFCPGSQGLKVFCPRDFNRSAQVDGVDLQCFDGVIHPDEGDCLSEHQVRHMAWLVNEWEDLGLIEIPDRCSPGTKMDFQTDTLCIACPPGHISDIVDAAQCEACPPGRYAVDGVECVQCPAGSFSNSSGNSACSNCSAGTYSPAIGQTGCSPCEPGHFAEREGQKACDRCPPGFYNDGSSGSECHQCADGETTQFHGAVSMDDCICPQGTFRNGNDACAGCPQGMVCAQGSDIANLPGHQPAQGNGRPCKGSTCEFPRTLPRYMTLPTAPLAVYHCMTEEACPGGTRETVSSCGPHRDLSKVACGLCADDSYISGESKCELCSSTRDFMVFFMAILLATLVLIGLTILVNRDMLLQRQGTTSVILVGGVFLTALQTVVVFGQLSLDWRGSVLRLMQICALFVFDLKRLKLECFLPVTPISRYLGRQLIAPCCLPVLVAIVGIKKLRSSQYVVRMWPEVGNSAGTVFSIFYISVVSSSVTPFVCYPHPKDSDTGSSMVSEPSVLCWQHDNDAEHLKLMVIAAITFILIPVTFFLLCACAVYKYPYFLAQHDERRYWWLHTFRFLFFRFKPKQYAYGVAILVRNLLISIIPAAIPGEALPLQVMLIAVILLLFLILQASLQPWRSKIANRCDSLASVVLILILLCGVLASHDLDADTGDVDILSAIILVVGALGLTFGMCIGMKQSLFPKLRYDFFLSHHKAAAAAQARYLHDLISVRLEKSCFLDSDNLQHLGMLFEVLKTSVSHFLIYLTKETLSRPWCAGEVLVAKESNLAMTKLLHPSYSAPSTEELENIERFMDNSSTLVEFNMDHHRVSKALGWLSGSGIPEVPVESAAGHGLVIFHDVVNGLATARKKSSSAAAPKQEMDTLILSTDPEDLEAVAAGGIIAGRIEEEVAAYLRGGVLTLADLGKKFTTEAHLVQYIAGARVVAVVLSEHTLHSVQQLQVIVGSAAAGKTLLSVSTPSFKFPTERYYQEVLPNLFASEPVDIQGAMKSFFAQIALPLSTPSSDSILNAECQQILIRVLREKRQLSTSNSRQLKMPMPMQSKEVKAMKEDLAALGDWQHVPTEGAATELLQLYQHMSPGVWQYQLHV